MGLNRGYWHDQRRGENSVHAKLTEEDVRMIRELYYEHRPKAMAEYKALTIRGLAEKFGVAQETVHDVIKHKTWKHV